MYHTPERVHVEHRNIINKPGKAYHMLGPKVVVSNPKRVSKLANATHFQNASKSQLPDKARGRMTRKLTYCQDDPINP